MGALSGCRRVRTQRWDVAVASRAASRLRPSPVGPSPSCPCQAPSATPWRAGAGLPCPSKRLGRRSCAASLGRDRPPSADSQLVLLPLGPRTPLSRRVGSLRWRLPQASGAVPSRVATSATALPPRLAWASKHPPHTPTVRPPLALVSQSTLNPCQAGYARPRCPGCRWTFSRQPCSETSSSSLCSDKLAALPTDSQRLIQTS